MTLIHPDFLLRDTVTFNTSYNKGSSVEIEITAKQKTDPLPGPSGLHVSWEVSRGVAEVSPLLPGYGYVARQQFVNHCDITFHRHSDKIANDWKIDGNLRRVAK